MVREGGTKKPVLWAVVILVALTLPLVGLGFWGELAAGSRMHPFGGRPVRGLVEPTARTHRNDSSTRVHLVLQRQRGARMNTWIVAAMLVESKLREIALIHERRGIGILGSSP